MRFMREWGVKQGAREDARSGLDSGEDRMLAALGPRPKLDPATNAEHAGYVSTLAARARIEELREDITQLEDAAARQVHPLVFDLGLVVTVVTEVVGALLIMRTLALPLEERLPLGVALAFALIGITAVIAHRTSARLGARAMQGGVGAPNAPRRSQSTLVVLGAYTLFVLAIAVVRVQSSADEGVSRLEALAHAAVMLATTLGPAWMAEWIIRRRAPATALSKRLRRLRRRLRDAMRAHERAEQAVNRIARDGAHWDAEMAKRRALYATHHRLENAKERKS